MVMRGLKYCVYREHFGDNVPGACRSSTLSDDVMEDRYNVQVVLILIIRCSEMHSNFFDPPATASNVILVFIYYLFLVLVLEIFLVLFSF